jgi:hypothetical protein
MLMFCNVLPEKLMGRLGRIYVPKPLAIKSRRELLAAIRPQHWRHLRADNGDLPESSPGLDGDRSEDAALRVL